MKSHLFVLNLIFLLALLSLTAPAWASVIYVSGDQTGTWSADTVIVTAEVRVPPGQSLTIVPGVEVLFSVYCKLIVDNGATLSAVGTAVDSIRFDVLPPNVNWHGIRFLSASNAARLEYCILMNGRATGAAQDAWGGAIYCYYSNPTISHNTISGNVAATGGGIYCYGGMPTISDNTISRNSASSGGGGGISCGFYSEAIISDNTINENSSWSGGGINCLYASPSISGNTITGNSASWAGGIYCEASSSTIVENTISGNTASGSGGGIGCAIGSDPLISGNTISGNTANSDGGGILCNNSSPTISSNTINGNSAIKGGGIACSDGSNPLIEYCTINDNEVDSSGGGIWFIYSNPIINNCTISGNTSNGGGGGMWFDNGDPIIDSCTVSGNLAGLNGGGMRFSYSSPTISNCLIENNESLVGMGFGGGGIASFYDCAPVISNCDFIGNTAGPGWGGAMCAVTGCSATFSHCTFTGNSATYGGGISFQGSISACSPTFEYCRIDGNSATGYGGGIELYFGIDATFRNCTISGNSTANYGSAIDIWGVNPCLIVNTIMEGNTGGTAAIDAGAPVTVTYGDFWNNQYGNFVGNIPPGFGQNVGVNVNGDSCDVYHNLFLDPLFVGRIDYHLQPGSPCIDAGDPASPFDPDGTIADIGCYYYDWGPPPNLTITITPVNPPIIIPATGGSFNFNATITNNETSPLGYDVWIMVRLPNQNWYGPVLGPISLTLPAGSTLNRQRTQSVPSTAPAGDYWYEGRVGDHPVAIWDTSGFAFTKSVTGDGTPVGDWACTGESFEQDVTVTASTPRSFALNSAYPNPFNASTVLSYQLPTSSHVSLIIYDTAGRLVTKLANGWRDAGEHQITFDGSGLPSGIYFAKLTAGDYSQVQKMVLMK